MLPTRVTVVLIALPLLLIPLTLGQPGLYFLVFGLQGLVLLLFLFDVALVGGMFGPRRVRVRRERPARLSLGVDNDISLVVANQTGRPLRLFLRDEPPPAFPANPARMEARVPPHSEARLTYRLLPTERGNFELGKIHLRLRGPLGLAWADRAVDAAEPVQVYPNLLEVRRYESLMRTTLVRAGGYHTHRPPGAGREFSHFRDYTPDDDHRHVNWKATARRGKPITAVHESEHSQDIIFCLDVGRMMAARVGMLRKLDHAINAVLMLAHVSQSFQDNLGLLVFSHEVHCWLPPTKGRDQHSRFLQALYAVRPEHCYVNYRAAFQYLIARHRKRALTMVFTDLLDAVVSAEYRDSIQLLKRFHLPLTLAVADVPLQRLAARTPEKANELYEVLVARDLLAGRAEMLAGLERRGVMTLDTVPERLTIDAVNRYLALKTGVRV